MNANERDNSPVSSISYSHSAISDDQKNTLKKNQSSSHLSVLGAITLDAIPLSWSKISECVYVLKAIRMCFGPYNTHCDLKFNTSEVFQKVHDIAVQAYKSKYKKYDNPDCQKIQKTLESTDTKS